MRTIGRYAAVVVVALLGGFVGPAGATQELELAGGRAVYCGPVRR